MRIGPYLQTSCAADPMAKPLLQQGLLLIVEEGRGIHFPDAFDHRLHFIDVLPTLAAGAGRPETYFGAYVYLHVP